jgi:hypothetical protein
MSGFTLEGALLDARRVLQGVPGLDEQERAEADKIIDEINRVLLRTQQIRELANRRKASLG